MAGERFDRNKFPGANLIVAVGKTAASDADCIICVRAKAVDKTQLGIQINRRERKTQREICLKKIRLIVIIKCVTGEWHVALKRLIIAELNQVARNGINLPGSKKWNEQRQPN